MGSAPSPRLLRHGLCETRTHEKSIPTIPEPKVAKLCTRRRGQLLQLAGALRTTREPVPFIFTARNPCMQLAALAPNFVIQEMYVQIHYNTGEHDLLTYIKNPEVSPAAGQGMVAALESTGSVSRSTKRGCGKPRGLLPLADDPVWRGPDGSVREW